MHPRRGSRWLCGDWQTVMHVIRAYYWRQWWWLASPMQGPRNEGACCSAWLRSSGAPDPQTRYQLILCPSCGEEHISWPYDSNIVGTRSMDGCMYTCWSQDQVQWWNHSTGRSLTLLLILSNLISTVVDYHVHMEIDRQTQRQDLSTCQNIVWLWRHEPNFIHQKPGGGGTTQDESRFLLQGFSSSPGLCRQLTYFQSLGDPARDKPRKGLYQHPIIQKGINVAFYVNKWDEGVRYPKYFSPFLLASVALLLTVVCVLFTWLFMNWSYCTSRLNAALMNGLKATRQT